MDAISADLKKIGFSTWFQERVDEARSREFSIARVISVQKDSSIITNGKNEAFAELTGKLMFSADSPLDYPTTGDWVYAQYVDDGSFAVIHEIFPRKSVLQRKTAGKKVEIQLLAANVDTALVMQSLDGDYNLRRLERYLVMAYESAIRPIVLLSKRDLSSKGDVKKKIAEIKDVMPDVQVLAFSNTNSADLKKVKKVLVPGETCCLLGSSGVGKTTLLNNLLENVSFETKAVREHDGKGRHATTRRQLITLGSGALIIDTPGLRELGTMAGESALYKAFDEIVELAGQCRFPDCSHTREDGCAIVAALEKGAISPERYQNYVKMNKEAAFHELSYREKRSRDKQFGKLYKSVMKQKVKE